MITTSVADQIIQVINDLCQKFGIVMDWSAENLVPAAEHFGGRIVDWCTAVALFWIILCGIFFIAGIVCIIYAIKCMIKHDVDGDIVIGLGVVGTIALVLFGIGLCYNIFDLVKCLTFPELRILEYIQSFMQ